MKEHQAGGKTKAKCTSLSWRRFNTSRLGRERVGSPVLRSENSRGGLASEAPRQDDSQSESLARRLRSQTGPRSHRGKPRNQQPPVCVCVCVCGRNRDALTKTHDDAKPRIRNVAACTRRDIASPSPGTPDFLCRGATPAVGRISGEP